VINTGCCRVYLIVLLGLIVAPSARSAEPFPPRSLPGISLGDKLPAGYETSGILWHPRLKKFFLVSDSGIVSSMRPDGTGMIHLKVPGDLEGVTVANPKGNFVYLGIENPDSIRELNIVTGKVTRTFDLTPWMKGPDNSGLEALAFVPEAGHKEGGLFYSGLQADGSIFVFELPIHSSKTSNTVKHVRTIPPLNGVADVADMYYDANHSVLYALYGSGLLRSLKPDGTLIKEWKLPGKDQEGVTLKDGDLFIGEDYHNGGNVLKYPQFLDAP